MAPLTPNTQPPTPRRRTRLSTQEPASCPRPFTQWLAEGVTHVGK